jgi:hypothetical protein
MVSSEFVSAQLARLARAVESVSANLSIVAVLGVTVLGLLPDNAGSALIGQKAEKASAPLPAPIEVVKAKPVPISPPAAANASSEAQVTKVRTATTILKQVGRRSRAGAQPESGDLGKAGAPAQAEKSEPADKRTPVAAADPKVTTNAEPPPPPDEWSDDAVIAALKDCLKRLAPLGAEVEVSTPIKQEACGTPAPVMLKRIGLGANRVEFQPPPTLNCAMVATLHAWVEKTLQPAAQDLLGSQITRIRSASGYACRNRVGTAFHSDRLSEHALANAIDISGFTTADGRNIDVVRNWGPNARDIRRKEIELADGRIAAAKKQREQLQAAVSAEREKIEEEKARLRPVPKDAAAKKERVKAQADLKQREKEFRDKQTELRQAENAEEREHEQRRALDRDNARPMVPKRRVTDASGRTIPVATSSEDSKRPPEATFLRRLHEGACSVFGTVLGPEANEAHRDHFHFDLAQRRRSAFCE